MLLSTVYRCVEVISDAVAQLPCKVYNVDANGYKMENKSHPAYWILNKKKNKKMSRFTFVKLLVSSMLLRGAGYAKIDRDARGNVTQLVFIPFESVTVLEDRNNIRYQVVGYKDIIENEDMICVLNFSYDGVRGVSTLSHSKKALALATDAENSASGFFRGGGNLSGVLKVQSSLTSKQKQDLKSGWNSAFNAQDGTPNGIAVLEGNMDFQPIQVNPADAQLLETRQYNVVDICRFFGVSPVKAFDLSKSSYSTVEATQLAFLTDTIAPLLQKIELEFERKIFKPSEKANIDVKFDITNLLRADKASQASYYNTLFQIGVVSPNEIRKELDLTAIEDGDKHFIQVNLETINDIVHKTDNTNA